MAVAKQFLFYPAEDNRGRNPKVWIELEIPFRPADMAEGAASASAHAARTHASSGPSGRGEI